MKLQKAPDWTAEVADQIVRKMNVVSERSRLKLPYTAVNGVHDDRDSRIYDSRPGDGLAWWTNGFWSGMLWLMYHETLEEKYKNIAIYSEQRLDALFDQFTYLHHDVGFMWLHTAVADYRLTHDPVSRKRGLHAATILAGRFNPAGRFIRAWDFWQGHDTTGWAIIDCMMNLSLLYWASAETGDPRFGQIAMLHADTVMKNFVRPDGSVHHIVEFDPDGGGMVQAHSGQGYAIGSSWTRGQAWGLYGFTLSYIHSGRQEYLDTAKRIAHYFIANIPPDGIIPIDFRQPEEPRFEDSTAAAIAASGLLEIAGQVPEAEQRLYYNAAIRLLEALKDHRCNWSMDTDYFLENGSGAYYEDEHHYPIIYGDYFFLEAIFRLNGSDLLLW